VISVGALTAGGAGKTPFARWLAVQLRRHGRSPAVLSRGYRSEGGPEPRVVDAAAPDARRDGDEPALLARTLGPEIPVIVCPDRARGASVAAGRGADVLVLDDGFQHRSLRRDVDVLLWDRTAAAARGRVLPAGALREPLRGAGRADLLVLVDRGDGPPDLPPHAPAEVFRASLEPGSRQPLEAGRPVHALSAVADPASFERSLEALGLLVTGATRFPDHRRLSASEVAAAADRAAAEGADFLAITAKDWVRWPRDPALPVPAVFDLDVRMEAGDRFLRELAARLPPG
jgi:tetraacyldisaccharide 4'-kinase